MRRGAGGWGKDRAIDAETFKSEILSFFFVFFDFCNFLCLQFCARLCKLNDLYQKTYVNYRFLGRAKR